MKKNITFLKRFVMVVLVFSMILLCPFSTYSMSSPEFSESMDATVELIDSTVARKLYKNAKYISKEQFQNQETIDFDDGLTVIYGANIDVCQAQTKLNKQSFQEQKNNVDVKSDKSEETTITNSETYMIFYMKDQGRVDIKYFSVSYAEDVGSDTIEAFIKIKLSDQNIDSEVKAFLNMQLEDQRSAMNRTTRSGYITGGYPCPRVYDYVYFIANYRALLGDYPVVVFLKDVIYEPIYIPDLIETSDTYYIVAFVNITPGNAISSSGYEEVVYNDRYSNKILIRGSKSEFHNLFPEEGDRFIQMKPGSSMNNIEGEAIDISLSYDGAELDLGFQINSPGNATIVMTTYFSSIDISYVKFLTTDRILNDNMRVSEEQYSYCTVMYMESATYVLSTRAATGVYYAFTNNINPILAGNGRDIYFEREE